MAKSKGVTPLEDLMDKYKSQPEKYIRTGILPVDLLTDGNGIPCSGYWHLWGPQGTGKSTLMLSVAKELAKQNRKTLFVSVEPSNKLFEDMGLLEEPYSDLIKQISPVTYNEAQEVLTSFFDSDFDLAVIDSISALSTTSIFEGTTDKTIEDHMVAPDAMPRLRLIKWLSATMRRDNTKAVFAIFHASVNFDRGWYGPQYVSEAGHKPQQFAVASSVLDGGSVMYAPDDPKKIIGRDLVLSSPWKNRFSALAGTKKGIPMRIIFGKGIGNTYTLLHYAVWKGYVKLGAWSTCNFGGVETKVQGKAARLQWIKEHYAELREDFYANAPDYVQALAGGFDAGDI